MNASALFEIGDFEYEVSCRSFSRPVPETRYEPGEDGDATPARFVTVIKNPEFRDVIPYDVFLLYLAADLAVQTGKASDLEAADLIVGKELYEACCEEFYEKLADGPDPDAEWDSRCDR